MLNKTILDRARMVFLFIALAGGVFKLLHYPGANFMLIIGLSSLSLYHILRAFDTPILERQAIMLHYVRNISKAVLLIGILFKMMHWPGSANMLFAGLGSLALSALVEVMSSKKEDEN